MPHACDRCGTALRRRTRATSACPRCGTSFYIDDDDGRPIRRHATPEEGAGAMATDRASGEDHPDPNSRP